MIPYLHFIVNIIYLCIKYIFLNKIYQIIKKQRGVYMAKKLALLLIFVLVITVVGCSKEPSPIEYQTKNFKTDASVEINGITYSVRIQKENENDIKMEFLSPPSVKGVTVEKTREGLFFTSGSVHVPIKNNTNVSAEALKLFSLGMDEITSVVPDMIGGVKVKKAEFDCSFGKATVFVSSDTKVPVLIEATVNGTPVTMTFSGFYIEE